MKTSFLLLALGLVPAAFAQDPAKQDPNKPAPAKIDGTARSIALPTMTHDLPDGPGHDVYLANCVSCHTSRYVSNQPRFPRKTWEAEVTKMVKGYGAPISDEDQKKIVDYLVAIRGVPDAPAVPPAK